MGVIEAFDASKVGDINALKEIGHLNEKLTDGLGATCIHYAARGGSVAVIDFLIKEHGFSIFTRSNTGATALHDAAARGNTAVVKWILDNTDIKVDDQDGAGITSLHLAARYGHILTVEWFIDEADSDISIRTAGGALPLHFAVVGGDINCVKILVDENPSLINMQMNNGTTAIYLACQAGHLEILKFLVGKNGATKIKAYDGMSCLHAAAQIGHLEIVQFLISNKKINPNDRDFDGLTPLHYAACRSHPQIVTWLLKEGGAKVALDNLGGSPLHSAAEHSENEECESKQTKAVVDLNLSPNFERFFLDLSVCIQALLDLGCDVSLTDNDGLTAAELADNCYHLVSASLIRGLITLPPCDSLGVTIIEESEQNRPVASPHLFFPPPPANPPEDDLSPRGCITTTTTATTNTSFFYDEDDGSSLRSQSPPLPPPPLPLPLSLSSPSTTGSPITPPSPIDGTAWILESSPRYSQGHRNSQGYHAPQTVYNYTKGARGVPQDSVHGAQVIHIVQAEVHNSNVSVPSTPISLRASEYSKPESKTSIDISPNHSIKSVISSFQRSSQDVNSTTTNTIITDSNTLNHISHNLPLEKENTSIRGNSSRVAQFKELFENKMASNASSKVSSFPTQPVRVKEAQQSQGASVINIAGNRATIISGKAPTSPPPSPDIVITSDVTVNGEAHDNGTDKSSPSSSQPTPQQTSVTSSSSNGNVSSKPSPVAQQQNTTAMKNDLISDIQSAVSGTSSLSLRSAKSRRADGVSMVYRSSKEIKKNGDAATHDNKLIQNNELTGDFDPKNFLDQIDKEDSSGRAIPEWRRLLLAKHTAEKALKDFEEKRKVNEYEARFKDMPAWKRALIERKVSPR